MLREVEWSEDRGYATGSEFEPIQFHLEALSNSKRLDLLLGYFSSAAINVLSLGFATFLYSGGVMRMVINNVLSQEDKDAIKAASTGKINKSIIDLSNIKELRNTLDDYGTHFFECLSWLIANDRIQIKVIKPKNGKGIAHYKNGVYSDGTDSVCFKSSCNFTAFGLLENLEDLETFLEWENSRSSKIIKRQNEYFEKIFSGEADFVEYLTVEEIKVAIRNEFGGKDPEDLLSQEKELIQKKKNNQTGDKLKKTYKRLSEKIKLIADEPRFPYPSGPRDYQIQAYENWVGNGYKGIFAMATGTGKTITSLNCLLNLFTQEKTYKAIIFVPTISLLNQWANECRKFNFKNIYSISSKINWVNDLAFLNISSKFTETSFIIIITYASATKKKFKSLLGSISKDTLIIADEVHNMGSPSLQKLMPFFTQKRRIGLSATPNRNFDEIGNKAIESFFNDTPPYVYSYSMKDALEIGWLSKYSYFPHLVNLTEDEMAEYIKISKQLMKFFDSTTKKYQECSEVEILLLKRKRIIHKAVNKKQVFKKIVESEFEKNQNLRFTLVYVPEGIEPNYSKNEETAEEEEDLRLINEFTRIVKDVNSSVMVSQFTSNTANRENIIKEFEDGSIHVLTSMKCLDEGVDVPRSELAIFCASTGNPRQFIQRRGRVLRLHKDKTHAVIHDLVVAPFINQLENNYEMERSLLKKEIQRVIDFSNLSINKFDTYDALKEVLSYYNINLYD